MLAGIHDLPAELVAELVSYLDQKDVFAFRQVSRDLERSSISYFGRRFFRKKGYLITTPSIETLESVAAHEDLKKYVQHVWFNPDCYTFRNIDAQDVACRESVEDHQRLLSSGIQLSEKLILAFRTLPNLRAVGMRRSENYRPWGWRTLKEATGIDPRQIGQYPGSRQDIMSEPTHLFIAIIKAVAASGVPIHRLYTDAIEIDNIPAHVLSQQVFNAACRNIVYLEINIHRGWLKKDLRRHITCESKYDYGDGLSRLLKSVPQLRELGLQVFADAMRSFMLPPTITDPNSWLRSYPHLTLEKQVTNVVLNHLRRLKLEKITTSQDVLKNFMASCKSVLASVKLRDIRLISSKECQRPWQSIFEFFRDRCPKLSYILLYHLMYEGGGISFVERPPTMVGYLDILDQAENPNPPHGEAIEGEFFTKYDHIALEASGRDEVASKLDRIVDEHWHQPPLFSYIMEDALWDTCTDDSEG